MNFKTLAEKHEILNEALNDYRAMETELEAVKAERDAISAELEQLGQAVEKAGYTVTKIDDGVYEVVKDELDKQPMGDYLNPIPYVDGIEVETGKWYIGEDGNIWDAIKDGVPTGFDDEEYFNIITV